MLAGIHVSASGGSLKALERAERLSLEAAQIFTSNQTQWKGRVIETSERDEFRARRDIPVISHGSYLVNLSSNRDEVIRKSMNALIAELERIRLLGIEYLVMHPGSHMGRGEEEGIELIAKGIAGALEAVPGTSVILLENTAGMGTTVGWRFEQLSTLITRAGHPERTGICLDTAHAFAAGYDLSSPVAVMKTLDRIDSSVGLDAIGAVHVNDSKTLLGSRMDRHASIGQGMIGLEPLKYLVGLEVLDSIPAIIETPGTDEDRKADLDLLLQDI